MYLNYNRIQIAYYVQLYETIKIILIVAKRTLKMSNKKIDY